MDLKKSTLRLASTLLAAVMLAQCVPMNAFAEGGTDLEKPELEPTEGYEVRAPLEEENAVQLDIPPTFVASNEVFEILRNMPEMQEREETAAENDIESLDADPMQNNRDTEEEGPYSTWNFSGSPFSYSYSDAESVNLNSGALEYCKEDYRIPGINGLDLVIGRRYNSQEATLNTDSGRYIYEYRVHFQYYKWECDENGNETVDEREHTGSYLSYESAVEACDEWEAQSEHGYYSQGGIRYEYSYEYSTDMERPRVYRTKSTHVNSHNNSLYGLGNGWQMAFSSIETFHDEKYLHLADGRSFELLTEPYNSNVTLVGHTLKDIIMSRGDYTLSGQSTHAEYRLSYKNGTKEYFSKSGALLRIEDRFENAIKFTYTTENGYPKTIITDTLNNAITISGNNTDSGHVMSVALPEGERIEYYVSHLNNDISCISRVTDPCGNDTEYSYTVEIDQDIHNEIQNCFLNLTTIVHPTAAQTQFTYDEHQRQLNRYRSEPVYKLESRKDIVGADTYNLANYTYSEEEYTLGMQHELGVNLGKQEYYTEITNAAGVSTKAHFNSQNLLTSYETVDEGAVIKSVSYVYNSDGLPTHTTTAISSYESTVVRTYDDWGNVTCERSPLAEGEEAPWRYDTDYTYDETYSLMLSQQYKEDENTTIRLEYVLSEDQDVIEAEKLLINGQCQQEIEYSYDSHGNITQERHIGYNGQADILIGYTYQNNAYISSKTVAAEDGPPQTVFERTYDSFGRVVSDTDGNGNTTYYNYNSIGDIIAITYPDDSMVVNDFDYQSNYVIVTNELGDEIKYKYNGLGKEYEIIDMLTGLVLRRKEYDELMRLECEMDFVYGHLTAFAYDSLDQVVSETVMEGSTVLSQKEFTYSYSSDGRKIRERLKEGNGTVVSDTVQYYDLADNLVKEGTRIGNTEYTDIYKYGFAGNKISYLSAKDKQNGLTFTTRYTYALPGKVARTYNALNQYTENSYDSFGRLASTVDYSGTPTLFEYDVQGRLTRQTVTITAGQTAVSEYEYDNAGNLILERTPANDVSGWNEAAYTYDSRNRLISATQYDGSAAAAVTTYTYDAAGNLLTMTAGGHTTAYTYDRFANLLSMTDPLGQSETYSYSALGKLEFKTDRNNITTSFAYDAAGRIVSIQAGTGTDADVVNYTYTASGQIARAENNWQITEYEYDGFGRVIAVYEGDKSGVLATSVLIDLDSNGGTGVPTQILREVGDLYDLPTPIWHGHIFDGWYLEETLIESDDLVTASQRHTLTAHWTLQESIVTLDACGGLVTPASVISQYGVPLELPTPVWTGHDFLGWYLGDLLVEDGAPSPITEDCTLYARWSGVFTVTLDYNDGTTPQIINIDSVGSTLTLPTPTRTGYTFDGWYDGETLVSMGGEIQITDDLTLTAHWTPNTYTVKYRDMSGYYYIAYSNQLCTYDEPFTISEKPKYAYASGKTFAGWSYTYGAATPDFLPGQTDVVNLTDEPDGIVKLWAVWRKKSKSNGSLSIQSEDRETDSRIDLPSDLARASFADSPNTRSGIASAPEAIAVTFHTKTYAYDLAGNRTHFELRKDGETIQSVGYAYDTLNRLTAVTEGGVTQASYTYDVNGNRSALTLANGVSTAYTYNAANWITSLTNSQNGTTLSSFGYTYYPSGNQASKTDQNGVVTTYEYDGLGRLTRESEQGGLTVGYAFDAAGNRASMAVSGTENYTVTYNYDANNCLISSLYTGSTTQSSYYTYDACGNLLTAAEWRPQEAVASTANYGYNGFNQLVAQTVNDVSSTFAYNADGIRTAKLTGNTLTGYLLDGGNVVAELEDDALSASYLRGANLISRTTAATEYYTFNAHGDVVNLTNASGISVKTYDYDAFGNEKDRIGADTNPFRYCGEYFDVESGSYYLRARYYDPSVGRFTQEDTHWNASNMIYGDEPQQIGEYEDPLGTSRYTYAPQITAVMQAGNLYGYGLGDPIRHFDPSGEIAVTTIILIGAAVVGLIAAGVEAHQSKKYTGKINWENTIIAGVSWFFIAATLGLTAYEVYLSYCAYTGQTPVTEVNFNGNDTVTHNDGKIAAAASGTSRSANIHFSDKKLQHEYKHAKYYGVSGNWSNQNKEAFKQAIINQVSSVSNPIKGTFRGKIEVFHYYDPVTGIDTIIDMNGNYIAGWKLSLEQINCLLTNGNVQ